MPDALTRVFTPLTLPPLFLLMLLPFSLSLSGGAIPRGRFLFLVCGFSTIVSGLNSGPPIIISPECGVAIKEGAKTGLSTLVCGMLFFVCTFASPLFGEIPAAGTMPMLFMVRECDSSMHNISTFLTIERSLTYALS